MPFVLPNTDSFSDYVKAYIIKPYRHLGMIEEIMDHFEIDFEDEEGKLSDDEVHSNKNNKGKNDCKEMQAQQKFEYKDNLQVTASRWDKVNRDSAAVAVPENDLNGTNQSSPAEKKLPKTEEILRKQDVKCQPNSENPLLANSRGKYIGRNLSSKFFDQVQVHVVRPSTIMPMTAKQIIQEKNVKNDEESEPKINDSESNSIHIASQRPLLKNPNSNLGTSIPFRLPKSNLDGKSKLIAGPNQSKGKPNSSGPSKSIRHGAAALAARAGLALRKKNKN